MKRSPDFTNVMTERPLEYPLAGLHSSEETSVWDHASRHAQLSVRCKQAFDRLLVLLPTHLKSQQTSHISPFPPALLFSVCDTLQHGRTDDSSDQNYMSMLPLVLGKLRDWRFVDPEYRYSSEALHGLALDLAGIGDVSTSSDPDRTSHARLRMKWINSDLPSESQDREPSSSAPQSPSPSRFSVVDSAQECAYALLDLSKRRSDAVYEPCQVSRLGTLDSEDASAVGSRRLHAVSAFRSGCSACRHPRVSFPSPSSQQTASSEQRMPFSDVNRFDTDIRTVVPFPRHPKPSVRHTTQKDRREKHKPLESTPRGAHIDENEPPPLTSMGVQPGSFPRLHTRYPRISNALLSRDPSSLVAAPVERRVEPGRLSHRIHEYDKHKFSHRAASIDLRLPMRNCHPSKDASPIDLHPHSLTRAQSFSYTSVNSHGLGSVAATVHTPSSAGSRPSKRLPSWSQTHLCRSPTTMCTNATDSLSPSPAKGNFENPPSLTRSRPSSALAPTRVPSDTKHRDRRPVIQTHKHTQSAGSLFLSRKWQV